HSMGHYCSVPQPVQHRLDESAHVSGSIDYIQLPPRRWWRSLRLGLSADEVHVIESAATTLQWPASLGNGEPGW
ncbi:hypothetical protein, partial [Rhodococcus pyridinivorans]|uniref:hypothetical protein n=2 Tax=Rhodococcus pyridinivorans TaxID=103816 RepID=UPI001BAFC6D8